MGIGLRRIWCWRDKDGAGGFVIGQAVGGSSRISAASTVRVKAGALSAPTIAVTEHAASAVSTMDFADREANTTAHLPIELLPKRRNCEGVC